jgi:hypothetical protein
MRSAVALVAGEVNLRCFMRDAFGHHRGGIETAAVAIEPD